ncbi:MAG: Gfo/Idh/MocA family oxidoreductase [Clostridiales bacterium]|nr:Gfo/Idh/MocA family oxidoreductase [Clostridiales bacterium]
MKKIAVGMYGINGHQLHEQLLNNDRAYCHAIAKIDKDLLPKGYDLDSIKFYDTFEEMINDDDIDVISLCSPIRLDQEKQAIMALKAGKHVYSEKPAALSETSLDLILRVAKENNREFHEMAGTCFEEPFLTMKDVVKSGVLGDIIQVFAQKSYPYHDRRPQDDITDGGITRWIGVHATRFIEHTTGLKIDKVYSVETSYGNPVKGGDLAMASSLMMTLDNGAVGSMICNYANQRTFGPWGNEQLRIWGTKGFVEAVDGVQKTRLVLHDKDMGALDLVHENVDYFEFFLDKIIDGKEFPITLEEELHPLRAVIRAKENVLERIK